MSAVDLVGLLLAALLLAYLLRDLLRPEDG